jgi:hypothetical protein
MKIDIPLFHGLALKIDNLPSSNNGFPTSGLQKGLILLDNGHELVEEAVGFGVPVLKRGLQTIFPGSVTLTELRRDSISEITASYHLNRIEKISKEGGRTVENRLFYSIKNGLAGLIRQLPSFRGLLTNLSNLLRRRFNWETMYVDAGFSIEVKVIFTIQMARGTIAVEIDAGNLPPDISEAIVMNEQGAQIFDHYTDSCGVSLWRDEISCWDAANSEEAWFESSTRKVLFKLCQVPDAHLFRGRELIDSRLSWAGFGYSFNPSIQKIQYGIKIERTA